MEEQNYCVAAAADLEGRFLRGGVGSVIAPDGSLTTVVAGLDRAPETVRPASRRGEGTGKGGGRRAGEGKDPRG